MVFQLRHSNISKWQDSIKEPFLNYLVLSILSSTDGPETQGCTATFLVICELPHLIHGAYETLARESVISQLTFTQL